MQLCATKRALIRAIILIVILDFFFYNLRCLAVRGCTFRTSSLLSSSSNLQVPIGLGALLLIDVLTKFAIADALSLFAAASAFAAAFK